MLRLTRTVEDLALIRHEFPPSLASENTIDVTERRREKAKFFSSLFVFEKVSSR